VVSLLLVAVLQCSFALPSPSGHVVPLL
jgi:hypothetical protein